MTGVGGDTGRGVRVAARSLRTWRRIVDLVLIVALAGALIAGTWKTWDATTAHDWHVMGVYALCEFMLIAEFSPDRPKKIRDLDGTVHVAPIGFIAGETHILALRDRILGDFLEFALIGGGIGGFIVIAALAGLRTLGRGLRRGRRLRGGELVSARALARRARPLHLLRRFLPGLRCEVEAASYAIAGIHWPRDAETRHTIVSGTTGAGKTVLIADLVEQIRARGERCVLYDKMGSYTETFFDPERDVLLNPLDARSPRWSPFLEARSARDFDTMAAALIPRQKDAADPFWITAARQLFSHGAAVLWKRGETSNRVLIGHLLKTELSALAEAMEGTVAQSIVDPENPKTALSVRAMLTANIGAMDLLSDDGPPFSIREWIEREGGGGSLFLTSRGDQHASLRGLISTWLEIAVNALLSLPRADGQGNALVRRIWVILDELPTLHQLPSLRPGLAESRQFGGCFVLGVQVFSALRELYGRDGAETISGLCGTRVVLAAPDRDTAEWSAESLGRVEMESMSEGVSYEMPREGVTLNTRQDLRSLVLPAEVARLENLSGYLKFPGAWPVARITLKYRERDTVAERFEPRAEEESSVGGGEPAKGVRDDGSSNAAVPADEGVVADDFPEGWLAPPADDWAAEEAVFAGMGVDTDTAATAEDAPPSAEVDGGKTAPSATSAPPESASRPGETENGAGGGEGAGGEDVNAPMPASGNGETTPAIPGGEETPSTAPSRNGSLPPGAIPI